MFLDIHLGKNKQYTITYEMFNNRVATQIWERFRDYQYDFVSRTQFYNFGESVNDVQIKVDESIAQIKKLLPGMFTDSNDLNKLHVNFPDLVKDAKGELRHWLSMFNYHLHHLEDITRYQNKRFLISSASGGPGPINLQGSDYDLFSLKRLPGYLYMNYPHVGKHILEICADNDVDIPADHIVPTHYLKNDILAWFGDEQFADSETIDYAMNKINEFCEKISHKLPYPPGDKKLAIGHICLGKVIHSVDFDMIAQNKYVHSVEAR